ncbi:uncharacterized protein LOC119689739 isoform X2 [Teleopsis dalmanni]|uniref:uncharacterized protein LOC119689739 isoform X2 n=1 Tax=Teleopsis dalmanni TaxID=139649 RepID=UPI0018CDD24D|nr:uncharacterized protein LOC119689739 isoform X2 [Teleopsis dalmanni]
MYMMEASRRRKRVLRKKIKKNAIQQKTREDIDTSDDSTISDNTFALEMNAHMHETLEAQGVKGNYHNSSQIPREYLMSEVKNFVDEEINTHEGEYNDSNSFPISHGVVINEKMSNYRDLVAQYTKESDRKNSAMCSGSLTKFTKSKNLLYNSNTECCRYSVSCRQLGEMKHMLEDSVELKRCCGYAKMKNNSSQNTLSTSASSKLIIECERPLRNQRMSGNYIIENVPLRESNTNQFSVSCMSNKNVLDVTMNNNNIKRSVSKQLNGTGAFYKPKGESVYRSCLQLDTSNYVKSLSPDYGGHNNEFGSLNETSCCYFKNKRCNSNANLKSSCNQYTDMLNNGSTLVKIKSDQDLKNYRNHTNCTYDNVPFTNKNSTCLNDSITIDKCCIDVEECTKNSPERRFSKQLQGMDNGKNANVVHSSYFLHSSGSMKGNSKFNNHHIKKPFKILKKIDKLKTPHRSKASKEKIAAANAYLAEDVEQYNYIYKINFSQNEVEGENYEDDDEHNDSVMYLQSGTSIEYISIENDDPDGVEICDNQHISSNRLNTSNDLNQFGGERNESDLEKSAHINDSVTYLQTGISIEYISIENEDQDGEEICDNQQINCKSLNTSNHLNEFGGALNESDFQNLVHTKKSVHFINERNASMLQNPQSNNYKNNNICRCKCKKKTHTAKQAKKFVRIKSSHKANPMLGKQQSNCFENCIEFGTGEAVHEPLKQRDKFVKTKKCGKPSILHKNQKSTYLNMHKANQFTATEEPSQSEGEKAHHKEFKRCGEAIIIPWDYKHKNYRKPNKAKLYISAEELSQTKITELSQNKNCTDGYEIAKKCKLNSDSTQLSCDGKMQIAERSIRCVPNKISDQALVVCKNRNVDNLKRLTDTEDLIESVLDESQETQRFNIFVSMPEHACSTYRNEISENRIKVYNSIHLKRIGQPSDEMQQFNERSNQLETFKSTSSTSQLKLHDLEEITLQKSHKVVLQSRGVQTSQTFLKCSCGNDVLSTHRISVLHGRQDNTYYHNVSMTPLIRKSRMIEDLRWNQSLGILEIKPWFS